MRRRFGLLTACVLVALSRFGGEAVAQSASPTPSPTPALTAFSAQAHAAVTVVAQGNTFAGSAQVAVAQRTRLTRIDLLSVKSDSFPVPPLSFTLVVDHRAHTITGWSDATKQYYVQQFSVTIASPSPSASPQGTPRPLPASPFSKLEVLDMSLHLTGHTTTAGLATTGLALDMQVRNKGDAATSHVAATMQLADDFAAFPVTIDLSIEPGTAPFSAKLAYAIDSLTRAVPEPAQFKIPAGYTLAPSMMRAIFPHRPSPSASPRP